MSKVFFKHFFHFVFIFCWRPLPGNFYATSLYFVHLILFLCETLRQTWTFVYLFLLVSASTCYLVSSQKFNRVNDKVCLFYFFFSLLFAIFCCSVFLFCFLNIIKNNYKRCEQKLRCRQVLNLALVQS